MTPFNPSNVYHRGIVKRAVWSSWFNLTPIMPNVERVLRESCLGIVDYPALAELAQQVVNDASMGVI